MEAYFSPEHLGIDKNIYVTGDVEEGGAGVIVHPFMQGAINNN